MESSKKAIRMVRWAIILLVLAILAIGIAVNGSNQTLFVNANVDTKLIIMDDQQDVIVDTTVYENMLPYVIYPLPHNLTFASASSESFHVSKEIDLSSWFIPYYIITIEEEGDSLTIQLSKRILRPIFQ